MKVHKKTRQCRRVSACLGEEGEQEEQVRQHSSICRIVNGAGE